MTKIKIFTQIIERLSQQYRLALNLSLEPHFELIETISFKGLNKDYPNYNL